MTLLQKMDAHLKAGGSVISFAREHGLARAAAHHMATKLGYAKFFLSPEEQAWLQKMPRRGRAALAQAQNANRTETSQ